MTLFRNAAGYYDPTAGKAILAVLAKMRRRKMRENYNDGDIIEITKNNGTTETALILKRFDGYATVLFLRENTPLENGIRVVGRQEMYADAGRPQYVFYDAISQYVKTIPDDEMERIRERVAETLGLAGCVRAEPAVLRVDSGMEDHDRLVRLEAERDIWKMLYEQERGH